jgi:hypothetical protein
MDSWIAHWIGGIMADGVIGYPGGLERRDYGPGVLPTMPSALRRISWGAVFAGLIVTIMFGLVLAFLGMSIGLGTIKPQEEANPFTGLGMGAIIWWVASSLISLFCGGWVAARMAGIPRGFDGALHGVLTWGLATLLTFYLLGTAIGKLIGGVSSMVGQGVSLMGQGAAAAAPQVADAVKQKMQEQGITLESIKQEGNELLRQTGKPGLQPGAAKQKAQQAGKQAAEHPEDLDQILSRMSEQGKGMASQADKDAAVNIVMNRTGKSRAEAERIVTGWQERMQQASQKLDEAKAVAAQKSREYGQSAASGMSKASLFSFIGLMLGGIAAAIGGRLGIPRDVIPPAEATARRVV